MNKEDQSVEKTDEEKKKLKAITLLRQGRTIGEVAERTGLPRRKVLGLSGYLARLDKLKEIKEREDREKESDKETNRILPYPKQIKPPEEFFREFIEPFGVTKEFIQVYYGRIKRRKELPNPNELAADLADMKSGITNARAINYIAEEYNYALQEYLREVGENEKILRRSVGIKVSNVPSPSPPSFLNYSFSVNPQQQQYPPLYPQPYTPPHTPPPYQYQGDYRYMERYTPQPHNPTPPIHNIYEELRSLRNAIREIKTMKPRENGGEKLLMNRIEKLEDIIRQQEHERLEKLEEELREAKTKRDVTREDVEQLVRRIFDEYQSRLTPQDVEQIIKKELDKLNIGLSREDKEYLITREKLDLERRKIEEKSKTRDVIASAIRSGFSSIGQAISRTLMETGTEVRVPVRGYTDITKSLWQVQCPGCGATITAPMGSSTIVCPQCGRQYSVEGIRPPSSSSTPSQKEFTCEICGKKFDTANKLRGHMIHHKRTKKQEEE